MTRDDDRPSAPDSPVDGVDSSFAREIQDMFSGEPTADVARTHLAAMTEAARESAHTVAEKVLPMRKTLFPTRTLRYAAIAVGAVVAAMSIGTGLSFAGVVTLPEPVRAVLHDVGIQVPDDDEVDEPADANDDAQGEDEQGDSTADVADDDNDQGDDNDDAVEEDDGSGSTDDDQDEVDHSGTSGSDDSPDEIDDPDTDDDSGSDDPPEAPEPDDSSSDGDGSSND